MNLNKGKLLNPNKLLLWPPGMYHAVAKDYATRQQKTLLRYAAELNDWRGESNPRCCLILLECMQRQIISLYLGTFDYIVSLSITDRRIVFSSTPMHTVGSK